ncbi:MAG: type IV pilus twitching motility protein PilT [Candidatus Omnitrophica bacterium]|nr:type IV pilus twitching motility protein PilT [Candidatus Omnitrophota bacterium]
MNADIEVLLKEMVAKKASDIHLTVNATPQLRIDGRLVSTKYDVLNPDSAKKLVYSILSKEHIEKFEKDWELDFSFSREKLGRFRVNLFFQRGSVGCAIRLIPFEIQTFEELGLPGNVLTSLCRKPKGLVLITGATGSGKSTTLASMVDMINKERYCNIITVEDPIEFVHRNKKAIVAQRELGTDTHSYGASLKHVLRQDPDVILIGEMRDLETIEAALIIAETGHLVFSTLHTSDCVQTINRVIDVFPSHQQQQIRVQLSFVLLAAMSQQLLPKAGQPGRVLATEVLLITPAVRSLIREMKVHQIYSAIQTGQREGMRTMNQSLAELEKARLVTHEDALSRTTDSEELLRLVRK